ncbi:uncharacterized protein LOC127279136 [Leptopilina boulardi]|uniref:uncharacterized protein LOC127279136 n=1 Tax=Leptopilina boulardi TaxID=63433 RepID=UPI0021F58F13|nr:uncharacterized protein LOC127279136 [Leptopilina boulardi]
MSDEEEFEMRNNSPQHQIHSRKRIRKEKVSQSSIQSSNTFRALESDEHQIGIDLENKKPIAMKETALEKISKPNIRHIEHLKSDKRINIRAREPAKTRKYNCDLMQTYLPSTSRTTEFSDDSIEAKIDRIINGMSSLNVYVKEIRKEQRIQGNKIDYLHQQLCIPTPETYQFNEKINLELPLTDLEKFKDFELKLQEADFRQKFSSVLKINFDPKLNVRKSVTNILRKVLSKSVALQFVTSKQTEGKQLFKDTELFSLLLSVISSTHKEGKENKDAVTEKSLLKELSSVLPNAKDWDGGRSSPKKKIF